jgi:Mor family transcriptional regulator
LARRSGHNKNEKSKRNAMIFREYQEGVLLVDLSKRYGLSLPRIHRIIQKEENKYLKEQNEKLTRELRICRRRR